MEKVVSIDYGVPENDYEKHYQLKEGDLNRGYKVIEDDGLLYASWEWSG